MDLSVSAWGSLQALLSGCVCIRAEESSERIFWKEAPFSSLLFHQLFSYLLKAYLDYVTQQTDVSRMKI